jgi:ketosteroid isomerase-like protein
LRGAQRRSNPGANSAIIEVFALDCFASLAMTPESGAPMKRSGYTLTILRKESGQWRLARDANLIV